MIYDLLIFFFDYIRKKDKSQIERAAALCYIIGDKEKSGGLGRCRM